MIDFQKGTWRMANELQAKFIATEPDKQDKIIFFKNLLYLLGNGNFWSNIE